MALSCQMTIINMRSKRKIRETVLKRYKELCNEVKCSICLDLYTEPIKLNTCHHTFCKQCYLTLFTNLTSPKSVSCPICKRPTERRSFVLNEEANTLVEGLKEFDRESLQKLDQTIDEANRRKRNLRQFLYRMENSNKVQRWIDSCKTDVMRDRYLDILSSDSDDDIKSISQTGIDNLNKLDELDLMICETKRKKKVIRRTKSLSNIITKVNRRRKKRHSTGNVELSEAEVIVIEEYDSVGLDVGNNEHEENRILNLLEEDVLKKFEIEMFGYAEENGASCSKNMNKHKEIVDSPVKIKMNIGKINSPKVKNNISTKTKKNKEDIDENSANNQKENGNNSAKKQRKSRKVNKSVDTSCNKGESSLNTSTAWTRMKAMKKDIRKSVVKKGHKYKQLDVSVELAKHGSKQKERETTDEQGDHEDGNKEKTDKENMNPEANDNHEPIIKQPKVVNLDDFEAYLSKNIAVNEGVDVEMIDKSAVEIKVEINTSIGESDEENIARNAEKANENAAQSEEDDIFSLCTQKLNIDEMEENNMSEPFNPIPTTEKDNIIIIDQDENRISSEKLKNSNIEVVAAKEQMTKQKNKKSKVSASDTECNRQSRTDLANINNELTSKENEIVSENVQENTKRDTEKIRSRKQKLIVNDESEIGLCSPETKSANINKPNQTEVEDINVNTVSEHMEAEEFIVDVQVHRSLYNSSFKSKGRLVEMEVGTDLSKQNRDDKNSVSDSDVISSTYNLKKHRRKMTNQDVRKAAIVVLQSGTEPDAKNLTEDKDGIITTSSKEDVKLINQSIKDVDVTNLNKESPSITNQVVRNNKITDSEKDVFSGSENSNIICLDTIPLRRSSRKSKPSAKKVNEPIATKKDLPKSTHKKSGIVQRAIEKWKSTTSESNADVQEEFRAGLKSALEQRNAMMVSLQNSLNANNNILSQLSNCLTNSESLFSESSDGKQKNKKQYSDLENLSEKPNLNLPEFFLSLPNFSGEPSKDSVTFFNTAIPCMDNINKLYHQIATIRSQIDNETENFTSMFNKSLLKHCDSSKSNSENAIANEKNKNNSAISNAVNNKINCAISNRELNVVNKTTNLELAVNKSSTVNVTVQTEVLNCPKCSYTFDIKSKDTSNCVIVPVPVEFSRISDLSTTQTNNSLSVPILREIQNTSNVANVTDGVRLISQTSFNNQSSASSAIQGGKKINRQLFSSQDEDAKHLKRKFKRIRTPTPDSDSEPMSAKKAKQELYHGKLYRDDLDIVFDSEMSETHTQNRPERTGDNDIVNYDEYMKTLLVKYDKDIAGETRDITAMEIVEEDRAMNVEINIIRNNDGTRKSRIETRAEKLRTTDMMKSVANKAQTKDKKNTETKKVRNTANRNTKKNTQDITKKYESILEQEFKTAQVSKPQPKAVVKTVEPPPIADRLDNLRDTVLDNIFNNLSFENAANSTLVEKTVGNSQTAVNNVLSNVSFENAANSTLVEKSGDKSQMSASMFGASENRQNKSVRAQKKPTDSSYSHDIISASMFTQVDQRNIIRRGIGAVRATVTKPGFDEILPVNDDDDDLDNEVANITSSRHVEDSLGSDKDIFGDDNIVESTPQKEILAQRNPSKFELSTNHQNAILGYIEPPHTFTENMNSEWLDNIAPPLEFQDTEQRDLNASPANEYPVINIASLTPDILPINTSAINPRSNHSALNIGFHDSQLNATSEHIVLDPIKKYGHSDMDIDNIQTHSSNTILANRDKSEKTVSKSTAAMEPCSTGWLSSAKNLNPLVLAQQEKFSPLQIIVNPSPPPRSVPSGTPKQKSILNYMSVSEKNENISPSKFHAISDYKSSPNRENVSTISRDCPQNAQIKYQTINSRNVLSASKLVPNILSVRDNPPQASCQSTKTGGHFEALNVKKTSSSSRNTSATNLPSRESLSKNVTDVRSVVKPTGMLPPNGETQKYSACIACTRLKRDETIAIISLTSKLNVRYSKDFGKQVTHLVVAVDERNRVKDHTIKYVLAISHGLWIVSFAWVKDCLCHGRLVDEDPYEVLDVSGAPGPRLSRLSRVTHPLLKSYVIHCAEPFMSVIKSDLENAIISLGGEIKKSPSDLQRETEKIRLILAEAKVTQDFDHYQMWRERYKILVVDIEWLSRSVGQYQVASVRPFILCLEEGIDDLGYPYPLIAAIAETPTQFTNTSHLR